MDDGWQVKLHDFPDEAVENKTEVDGYPQRLPEGGDGTQALVLDAGRPKAMLYTADYGPNRDD